MNVIDMLLMHVVRVLPGNTTVRTKPKPDDTKHVCADVNGDNTGRNHENDVI
jgi:hypothetical protein